MSIKKMDHLLHELLTKNSHLQTEITERVKISRKKDAYGLILVIL